MKKIILTFAAVIAFGAANAQTKKETTKGGEGFSQGDVFVSGSIGFDTDKTGNSKGNSFDFSPKVGFFVTENIAVGAELGVGTTKTDNGTGTEVKKNGFNGGVFGRYYFTPASKFSLFANLGLGFGSNKTTTDVTIAGLGTVSTEAKSKTINAGLGLGLNYFVAPNWALEATWAGLGYTSDDNGGNGADKTSSFGLNANLSSINFGVLYKF